MLHENHVFKHGKSDDHQQKMFRQLRKWQHIVSENLKAGQQCEWGQAPKDTKYEGTSPTRARKSKVLAIALLQSRERFPGRSRRRNVIRLCRTKLGSMAPMARNKLRVPVERADPAASSILQLIKSAMLTPTAKTVHSVPDSVSKECGV